jgi:hypothetical protein
MYCGRELAFLTFSVFLALVITRGQNHTLGHKSPLMPLINKYKYK